MFVIICALLGFVQESHNLQICYYGEHFFSDIFFAKERKKLFSTRVLLAKRFARNCEILEVIRVVQ